jgi:DNA topoisomerase-1
MSVAPAPASLPASWKRLARDEETARRTKGRIRQRVAKAPALDPVTSAEVAELRYVDHTIVPGIRRVGHQRVRYLDPNGRVVSSAAVLQRIKALAIPPAWTDVWICPDPLGHLQATGRDARGRKQYRYHPRWREVRDEVKYGRLLAFAGALPRIRSRVAADLRRPALPRAKVIAAVVQLLEKTLIRVGNKEYARDNQSFGLTTMHDTHAKVNGTSVRFEFRGKSRVFHTIDLHDARLAKIVKACRDLPGHELFQYVDDDGQRQAIGSADVNEYLRSVTGQPFTSKDFRTWAGTVLVVQALNELADNGKGPVKRHVVRAIEGVAKRLGNTTTVCRKCYIHPAVLDAYMEGRFADWKGSHIKRRASAATLSPEESAVVALLGRRRG